MTVEKYSDLPSEPDLVVHTDGFVGKLFINGHEVGGVRSVESSCRPNEVGTVTVTFFPKSFTIQRDPK